MYMHIYIYIYINRGFANGGFRNRGNVPCAHAKTLAQGPLSQGFRIPETFFGSRKNKLFPEPLLREVSRVPERRAQGQSVRGSN